MVGFNMPKVIWSLYIVYSPLQTTFLPLVHTFVINTTLPKSVTLYVYSSSQNLTKETGNSTQICHADFEFVISADREFNLEI
jgi:hypothetical protein